MDREIRELIRRMSRENTNWRAPRIHGELLKLGFKVSERTVSRYLPRREPSGDKVQKWMTFLRNHRKGIAAMDFFTVPTLFFRQLYCFFVIHHDRRKLIYFNVTFHPTSQWVVEQLKVACQKGYNMRYMIYDRSSTFSSAVKEALKVFGVESVRTSFRSPWQNGVAERWVGSCRGELLNHVIILNKQHLYRLMVEYVAYYNEDRTHYSLGKDPPDGRPVTIRQSADDEVIALQRCAGLHRKYIWKSAA